VRFGPLRLGTLEEGRYRRLTAAEVERLRGGER
jgi:16S rRNA U516 pseudouridylate synthase RsuA-like enzyme